MLMATRKFATALLLTTLMAPLWAGAQQSTAQQVIEPKVDRRDVRLPRIPSNDIEIGAFVGTYGTQNFGSSAVAGIRIGYHVTEDVFVEGTYGATRVTDQDFRLILPGGIFPSEKQTLSYYNVSAGYNVLPGEVFIGSNTAKATAVYLIGGIGSTRFLEQRRQTVNVGLGLRLFMRDWAALQVDMRDHIFSLDILGRRRSTQNLELSTGLTFFF
jgi:outer membrane beta-barrel protein